MKGDRLGESEIEESSEIARLCQIGTLGTFQQGKPAHFLPLCPGTQRPEVGVHWAASCE